MNMNFAKSTLIPALTGLVLLTSACDDDYDFPHCEDAVFELEADAITPSGHSVAEILAAIEGERETQLSYLGPEADGVIVEISPGGSGTTTLSLELTPVTASKLDPNPGALRWIESEAVYPTSGVVPAIAIECPDRLEIDAQLGFATLDGAFDELVQVTVRAALDWDGELSHATILHDYEPEELDGDLRVESIEPANPTRVDHSIEISYALTDAAAEADDVELGAPFGSVGGGAEYRSGDVASYARFVLASFGGVDPW